MIDDIRNELSVSLRLIPASHYPKRNPNVIFHHESGNDRVQRTLMASQKIWAAWVQAEEGAAILQSEASARCDNAGAERLIITLNVGNHVALLIHHTQISRVRTHCRRLAGKDVAVGFFKV